MVNDGNRSRISELSNDRNLEEGKDLSSYHAMRRAEVTPSHSDEWVDIDLSPRLGLAELGWFRLDWP